MSHSLPLPAPAFEPAAPLVPASAPPLLAPASVFPVVPPAPPPPPSESEQPMHSASTAKPRETLRFIVSRGVGLMRRAYHAPGAPPQC